MNFTNIFYAKHPNGDKQYIFMLPDLNVKIGKGDKLRVKCRGGVKTVVATGPNWIIPSTLAKATAEAMGGYWPLAAAFGKVESVCMEKVTPFDPLLNPAEYELFAPPAILKGES